MKYTPLAHGAHSSLMQRTLYDMVAESVSSYAKCGYDDCGKTAVDAVLHEYNNTQYVLLVCKKHMEWEITKISPPPETPWGWGI